MAKMNWKRFFNSAFETQEAANEAKAELVADAEKSSESPSHFTNWIDAAGKSARKTRGKVRVPEHVVVDLPGNWQVWLADDGSHREPDDAASLSGILANKAKEAGLAYPLLVRSGFPCSGTAGFLAADPDGIGDALAKAFAASAAPSPCAVLISAGDLVPGDGETIDGNIVKAVVDYSEAACSIADEPQDGGSLAKALAKFAGTGEPPCGMGKWNMSLLQKADGKWAVLSMLPVVEVSAEPEKPKHDNAYTTDSSGRLVDQNGNIVIDDENLADGVTPTLDENGELIGEAPPAAESAVEAIVAAPAEVEEHHVPSIPKGSAKSVQSAGEGKMSARKEAFLVRMGLAVDGDQGAPTIEPIDVEPGPGTRRGKKRVDDAGAASGVEASATGNDASPAADGGQESEGTAPPEEVMSAIPGWLLPLESNGESLRCHERSGLYEFRVGGKDGKEGWAYMVDADGTEIRLLRDTHGNPVEERNSIVPVRADESRPGKPEPATAEPVQDDAWEAEAEQSPAAPLPADAGQDGGGEPAAAGAMEPEPAQASEASAAGETPAAEAEQGDPKQAGRVNSYLATRPELEPVEGRTFGEFLADLMGAKGIRADELAQLLEVSRSSVYHYISNSKRPSFNSLKFMTDYFDCNMFKW